MLHPVSHEISYLLNDLIGRMGMKFQASPLHSSNRRSTVSLFTRIVDSILVLALIVGICLAWPIQSEAWRLHTKRVELQRKVGEMPIRDPSKFHVLLLKSDIPLEFQWPTLEEPLTLIRFQETNGTWRPQDRWPGYAVWIEAHKQ